MAHDSIIAQYRQLFPSLAYVERNAHRELEEVLLAKGIEQVTVVSHVKTEAELTNKLEALGDFASPAIFNDLVTLRVLCNFIDDMPAVEETIEDTFSLDIIDGVKADKVEGTRRVRRQSKGDEQGKDRYKIEDWRHEIIGYAYSTYVCYLSGNKTADNLYASWVPFTVTVTTRLHDAWENLVVGLGYAHDVETPSRLRHDLIGTSYMMEQTDRRLSKIFYNANRYREEIAEQVARGNIDLLEINVDTFGYWLATKPFDALNMRIAEVVGATVTDDTLDMYLPLFEHLKIFSYQQANAVIRAYEDNAFEFARRQLEGATLPTISSSVGVQYIAIAYVCAMGGGVEGIANIMEVLGLDHDEAVMRAPEVVPAKPREPSVQHDEKERDCPRLF